MNVHEKKISKIFPLKLNFALSVSFLKMACQISGVNCQFFFSFSFFFPGFNLLAKEKKTENKSNLFLKKLQGNEDYYTKFY